MRFHRFGLADRTKIIALLRERDGDDCRICKTSIDFTILEERHPGVATIDHVVTLAERGDAGDVDRIDNLQLAHGFCNGQRAKYSAKPAWYARALQHALEEWPKPTQRERREGRKKRRGIP